MKLLTVAAQQSIAALDTLIRKCDWHVPQSNELRTSWSEGKHNLDELLPEIISNLFKAAILRRRDRLKQAAEAEARRGKKSS